MHADTAAKALDVSGVSCELDGRRALDDCSVVVPSGSVTALVGRNGAGKTTLLRVAAGLLRPDRGSVRIFGEPLGDGVLPRIAYVGQQAPLYRALTVAETLRVGARLNPRWDAPYARQLTEAAGLPLRAKVGSLAPGQRMRLALAMALGKRPGLLLLDEPLAALDPVARADVAGVLMAEVADHRTTVVLSAHVVADIEATCDHVVVLDDGRVRLAAEVEAALAGHWLAVGATRDRAALDGAEIVDVRGDAGGFTALVRTPEPVRAGTLAWHRPTLDDLLLSYLRRGAPQPTPEVPAA